MDCFVVGPIHLTVVGHNFCNLFRNLRSKIRRNLRFFCFVKYRGENTVKCLGMDIVFNRFRIGNGAFPSVIVFHDGTHLCQIFRLRDHLFLVLLQCVLDPLGETVVIGRILLILFADAAGQFAGNSICLCSKRSQLLQFPLKVILVQNIDGAGNLLQASYREVCIQKILHQRLIFPVINGIAVTDFHAAAHLGEKDKSVLILLQFIFQNGCIRLFRIQHYI